MKRLSQYILLTALAGFLVWKGILPGWQTVHSDFANYYVSAKLIIRGQRIDSLYNNAWFQDKIQKEGLSTQGKFAPFPPITAWMTIPLASLEPLTAQRILTVINLLFLLPGIILCKRLTQWETLPVVLIILGAGLGLANNFAFGQVYWIMTVAILWSLLLMKKSYPVLAGVILAVFTAVKYFPVVFIAGYVLAGLVAVSQGFSFSKCRLRLVVSFVISLTILVGVQYAFFGAQIMTEFFHAAFLPHLNGQLTGQVIYSFGFQSWNGLLTNLFVADAQYNPHPLFNGPQAKVFFLLIIVAIVAGSMFYTIYRYRRYEPEVREAVCLALPALAFMVILPASATYHFILLLVPLMVLRMGNVIPERSMPFVIALFCLVGFIPYGLFFRLADTWGIIFAYPRLWIICLLYFSVILILLKATSLRTVK